MGSVTNRWQHIIKVFDLATMLSVRDFVYVKYQIILTPLEYMVAVVGFHQNAVRYTAIRAIFTFWIRIRNDLAAAAKRVKSFAKFPPGGQFNF